MSDTENELREYLKRDLAMEQERNAAFMRLRRLTAISVTALAAMIVIMAVTGAFVIHTLMATHTAQMEIILKAKKEICQLQAAQSKGALAIISQQGTSHSLIQTGK